MSKEAMKLALEALELFCECGTMDRPIERREALRQAIEQAQKQEPVAWIGIDLDNMVEAFHRVIEEHHSRKNPFHDPVNRDAMLALRELRGLIAYMKRYTAPPVATNDTSPERVDEIVKQRHEQAQPVAWMEKDVVPLTHIIKAVVRRERDETYTKPLYTSPPQRQPLTDERLELIGHADLTINNIYVFSGYGEEVPEGRTPIYAGYKAAHGIKGEA